MDPLVQRPPAGFVESRHAPQLELSSRDAGERRGALLAVAPERERVQADLLLRRAIGEPGLEIENVALSGFEIAAAKIEHARDARLAAVQRELHSPLAVLETARESIGPAATRSSCANEKLPCERAQIECDPRKPDHLARGDVAGERGGAIEKLAIEGLDGRVHQRGFVERVLRQCRFE